MCGVFGFVQYGDVLEPSLLKELYEKLASVSVARGTDAGGISYVHGGEMVIRKMPGSLPSANFKFPGDVVALMAHCRMALLGDHDLNDNNHPFRGTTRGSRTHFALAHNGILSNLKKIREAHGISATSIKTDSYGAVQLLNMAKSIGLASLRRISEGLSGSFLFTVLDEHNNLFFCRGDVPVFLVHFKKLKLYMYASTRDLFEEAIRKTKLNDIYVTNNIETANNGASLIPVNVGEIVGISREGEVSRCRFHFKEEFAINHNWYMHNVVKTPELKRQIDSLGNE